MSQAYVVAGLGWGDESKGATVDKLCRELPVDLIVRYNGGCQAAHHVVLEDGHSHCFSQFGSGMLANKKVRTHLSRFMLVNPLSMMNEAEALNGHTYDVWQRTTVDRNCIIITPLHRRLNRLREQARGAYRHGSCGQGVGAAREYHLNYGEAALFAKDLEYPGRVLDKLRGMEERFLAEMTELEDKLGIRTDRSADSEMYEALLEEYASWPARIVDQLYPANCMVFEGAQGVLLDEKHGQAPYNTWTNTTFENADTLLGEAGVKDRVRIGCLRTYHTRHGAGPFPTESHSLNLPEPHNDTGEYQGAFRVGGFDFLKARQAVGIIGGIDCLSLSHIDYLQRMGLREDFAEDIASILKVPLAIKAYGPTARDREVKLGVTA